MGVVRVVVAEDDHLKARKIIDDWESIQTVTSESEESKTAQSNSGFLFIIGLLVGVGGMSWLYHSSLTEQGVDYNNDGILDEKWFYLNDILSKTKVDRNLDGNIDIIYDYGHSGLLTKSKSDENFDGTFDTVAYYKNGNMIWSKADTNQDGFNNLRWNFKNGVLSQVTFFDPKTKDPIKIQYYDSFKLIRSEIDANRDGSLDTIYHYDEIEEIISKVSK